MTTSSLSLDLDGFSSLQIRTPTPLRQTNTPISPPLPFCPSILNPNSTTPFSTKNKSKTFISLIKSEKNPETILEICHTTVLTPCTHLDRLIFTKTISKLSESNYYKGIKEFSNEFQTRSNLKNERFSSHCIVLYGKSVYKSILFKYYIKVAFLVTKVAKHILKIKLKE